MLVELWGILADSGRFYACGWPRSAADADAFGTLKETARAHVYAYAARLPTACSCHPSRGFRPPRYLGRTFAENVQIFPVRACFPSKSGNNSLSCPMLPQGNENCDQDTHHFSDCWHLSGLQRQSKQRQPQGWRLKTTTDVHNPYV